MTVRPLDGLAEARDHSRCEHVLHAADVLNLVPAAVEMVK